MPVKSFWDDTSQTLFRVEMHDGWRWDDFSTAIKEAYELIAKLEHDVNLVVGFYSKLPSGAALQHLTAAGNQPSNLRHSVILNQCDMVTEQIILSFVQTVVRVNDWEGPKFLDTMEEARAHFARLKELED